MISLPGVVSLVICVRVAGPVFWPLHWHLTYVNPPEPFRKVGRVVPVVLAVLVLIYLLLSLAGGGPVFRP